MKKTLRKWRIILGNSNDYPVFGNSNRDNQLLSDALGLDYPVQHTWGATEIKPHPKGATITIFCQSADNSEQAREGLIRSLEDKFRCIPFNGMEIIEKLNENTADGDCEA